MFQITILTVKKEEFKFKFEHNIRIIPSVHLRIIIHDIHKRGFSNVQENEDDFKTNML